MKRVFVAILLAVLALAPSGHTTAKGKPQVGGSLLGVGLAAPFKIQSSTVTINEKKQTDVQNYTVTWDAGASTGWHYHVGVVVVVITSGAVKTYNESTTGCAPVIYRKGQVFVEPPLHVHNVITAGGSPATAVTSEFITHGKAETVNVARPANCPKI